jgi:hypothetical protein
MHGISGIFRTLVLVCHSDIGLVIGVVGAREQVKSADSLPLCLLSFRNYYSSYYFQARRLVEASRICASCSKHLIIQLQRSCLHSSCTSHALGSLWRLMSRDKKAYMDALTYHSRNHGIGAVLRPSIEVAWSTQCKPLPFL